jgi:hypothetical protein
VVKTLWWLMSIFAEFARRTVESEISKDLRSKKHEIHALCRLRSYVVLGEQVVWNEVLAGSGLCISFHPEPTGRRFCSLVRQV